MKLFLYVFIPLLLNLAGLLVVADPGGLRINFDYLSGTFSGIVLSVIWFVQMKMVDKAGFHKLMKIIFGGFFVKLVVITASFFMAHKFFVTNDRVLAISLLSYVFFLFVSEMIYYYFNSKKLGEGS